MTDLDRRLDDLPIFPLPKVVLLPGQVIPLHVFEPRYRALVADLLEGDGVFGMPTIAPDMRAEPPALWSELGVAKMIRHQPLPDGRSNLLAMWIATARIVGEHAVDTPYRRVRAEAIPEPEGMDEGPDAALRVLAAQVVAKVGPIGHREQLFELEGRAWLDAMAGLFVDDPERRRAYLVAPTVGARRSLLTDALVARLAEDEGAPLDA